MVNTLSPLKINQFRKMSPLLNSIARTLIEAWRDFISIRTIYEALVTKSSKGELTKEEMKRLEVMKADVKVFNDLISGYLGEVEKLGGIVEGLKVCAFGFPIVIKGSAARMVMLSWTPADGDTLYFHEVDESFTERQPIINEGVFV